MPPEVRAEPGRAFAQVVLAAGHMVDRPDRSSPRFPPSAEAGVTAAVRRALEHWDVGTGALLVCGGARGSDIIAAEQALARGAEVWLLVPLPDEAFVAASVHLPGTDWSDRYRNLRRRCPTWFLTEELAGPMVDDNVFERNTDWCLRVARAEAPPGRLRVLAVWDGSGGDGEGGTASLVERARRAGACVEVISPDAGGRR